MSKFVLDFEEVEDRVINLLGFTFFQMSHRGLVFSTAAL